ncbi:MAG: hypothetical protein ACJ799_02720 [Gemmatimonadaceae bacterium]
MSGALLYAATFPAAAQVVPPPASQVPIPVKPATDSGPDSARVKADTIKPPIGRSADPALYEIGPQYEWNRTDLLATGALTVVDLLDRIPGVTTFRSGWLATPQTATHNGDFRRVRVFYDGIEIDNLDNTTGGVLDLSSVQLWSLEHLSIERTASELRLYMRSWRVDNVDPYTHVDVATGNEDTNLYRGFYGKRFDNGGVLQFAGQQYGVTSSRFAGSGDALSLLTRVGVAKQSWSVDAFVLRHHPTRNIQRPAVGSGRPPVLGLDATYTDAYLRAAVGGVNSGQWAQLTIASLGFKGTTDPDRNVAATSQPDTLERRFSETQYRASGGLTFGPLRLEVEDRLRALAGTTYNGVSGRIDLVSPIGVVSGFAEHDGFRGTTNADVGLRAQPLPFVALSGSIARSTATGSTLGVISQRGEVAIKLFRPWVSVGMITTDKTAGLAPLAYDTLLLATSPGRTSAGTVSIRGPVWAGFGIDAWLLRWDNGWPYQPRYQSRSEINYTNNFERRFPRGDFGLKVAGIYEYRGHTIFPLAAGDVQSSIGKTVSAILEIRILRAVISYQQRNIMGYQYEVIPGFEMPRVLAIYGVRWDFWN